MSQPKEILIYGFEEQSGWNLGGVKLVWAWCWGLWGKIGAKGAKKKLWRNGIRICCIICVGYWIRMTRNRGLSSTKKNNLLDSTSSEHDNFNTIFITILNIHHNAHQLRFFAVTTFTKCSLKVFKSLSSVIVFSFSCPGIFLGLTLDFKYRSFECPGCVI